MKRRITRFSLTCLLATSLSFFALRALPGDSISAQLSASGASPQAISERRAALGLDQPLLTQYFASLLGALRGDLGRSLSNGRPVVQIIGEQLEPTLQLAFAALVIAVLVGITLGLLAGAVFGSRRGTVIRVFLGLLQASPVYWTGTLLIFVFSVGLRILPFSGGGDLRSLILPATVLGLSLAGGIAQVTANATHEALQTDFIRTARAKGLRERMVILRHAFPVALPSILPIIALQAGFIVSGAAITEALFVRPGVGRVLVNAINERDYPVIQGVVLLSAIAYSTANLFADVFAAWVDPRLRD